MKPLLTALMLGNAALFVFGALQHAGVAIGSLHEPVIIPASVVEVLCALALSWGAAAVLKQSLKLAGIGAASGATAALGVSHIFSSEVGGTMFDQLDPLPFALGMLLVMAASASAAYFPCRRAARIEPVTTLRCD